MLEEPTETEKILEELGFCVCGMPEEALKFLRELLNILSLRTTNGDWAEAYQRLDDLIPNQGQFYFTMNMLAKMDLIEHGSSIGGSWLTPKGKDMLARLNAIDLDTEEDE